MNKSKLYIIPLLFLLTIFFVNATTFLVYSNSTNSYLYTGSSINNLTFKQNLGLTINEYFSNKLSSSSLNTYFINSSKILRDIDSIGIPLTFRNVVNGVNVVQNANGDVICYTEHKPYGTPYLNALVYCSYNSGLTFNKLIDLEGNLFRLGSVSISEDGNTIIIDGGNIDRYFYAVYNKSNNLTPLAQDYLDSNNIYTTITGGELSGNGEVYYYAKKSYSIGYSIYLFKKVISNNSLLTAPLLGYSSLDSTYINRIRTNTIGDFVSYFEVGTNKTYYSKNYGVNWYIINNTVTYEYDKANDKIIYALTNGSVYIHDTNTKININQNFSLPFSNINSMYYSDDTLYYIIPTPKCINENTYCTQPYFYNNEYSCAYENTYNCNNGCDDSTGTAICNNNCGIVPNPLSCNILGARNCIDSTTVGVCDDWNLDGCYTYAPSSTCPTGQFCLQSGNYFGSCVNTTESGTHAEYGLLVTPYSTSDANTSYTDNSATRTVSVNTIFSAHTQDFYTTGTYYLSRTCDYTAPVLLSTGYANVTNYANDSVQTLTSATNSDTIVKLSFTPSSYSEGWITLTDTLGSVNSKYYYQRNYSQKRMCIYDNNLLIIYCDYSTNSFDDLTSVDLEYSFQFATKTYSVKATFNRAVDNVRIIGVQTFLGQNIYQINVSQFIDFESTIINNLVITSPTAYNTFTSNTGGTKIVQVENPNCNCGTLTCSEYKLIHGIQAYNNLCLINQTVPIFVQPCIFTSSGNHLVRTYGNNNGVPDYSTYKDYNVNIVGLGLTQEEVENSNPNNNISGKGLPQYMKYIIVAITILLCIGIFLGIGITTDTIKVNLMVGVVLSLFAVIIYTILGWISAWIIVAIIIIGLAIVILLGSMKSSANG